jgi:hypothetical protein
MGPLSECQTQIGARKEPGLISGIFCGRFRIFFVLLTCVYYRNMSNEQ